MENAKTLERKGTKKASAHHHEPVVEELIALLENSPKMGAALVASLNVAGKAASKTLNSDLYNAINNQFQGNGWPKTLQAYYDYLDIYVRLVPDETRDPNYPAAWTSNGEVNGYNQKIYDLLCQFYWLVDQPNSDGKTMQSFPEFATWLRDFATAWGEFLDTDESLTPESLRSFKYDTMYNYHLYSANESTWKTFNNFFYREFNGADPDTGLSPLRPIAAPNDNTTIVAPADCTYKQYYPIDGQGNVLDSTGKKIKVKFKNTHSIGTIDELLDGSPHAKDFYGGTFVHYFLSPFDYHRFHTPVSGTILESKPVVGKVFLDVNLQPDGQFDAPDGGEDGYEFTQSRGVLIMDAGPVVGKVAVVPIGMAQVSGVDMYTQLQGTEVVKGQEFGKFKFGGSDNILLFQKPPSELYMFQKDPAHNAIHFQYGQTAVYWNK